MTRTIFVPFLLCTAILFAGCGRSNLEKINGEWRCDAKATIAAFNGTAKNVPGVADLATGMLENINFLFHTESKKLTRSFGPVAEVAAFTVVSDSGNTLVLQMDKDKIAITFQTDDSIAVANENNGEKMIFTRVKK